MCRSTVPSSTVGFESAGARGHGVINIFVSCHHEVLIKERLQPHLQTAALRWFWPKSDAGINISGVPDPQPELPIWGRHMQHAEVVVEGR